MLNKRFFRLMSSVTHCITGHICAPFNWSSFAQHQLNSNSRALPLCHFLRALPSVRPLIRLYTVADDNSSALLLCSLSQWQRLLKKGTLRNYVKAIKLLYLSLPAIFFPNEDC